MASDIQNVQTDNNSLMVPSVVNHDLFGSVRVVVYDDKSWFCLADIGSSLHFVNPHTAVKAHCQPDGVRKFLTDTPGGKQSLVYIDSANLFRMMFHSPVDNVDVFHSWIFDTVLPSIQHAGMYLTPSAKTDYYNDPARFNERLNRMEDMLVDMKLTNEKLLVELSSVNHQLLAANNELIAKDRQLHMAQPALAFYEYYYKNNNQARTASYYADLFGVSPVRFNQILVSFGVLREYRTKNGNVHRCALNYWRKYVKPVVSTFTVPIEGNKQKQLRIQANPASPGWLPKFYSDLIAMFRKYDMLDGDGKFYVKRWEKARDKELKRHKKERTVMPQAWAKSYFEDSI